MLKYSLLLVAFLFVFTSCLPDEPGFEAFRKSQIQLLLSDLSDKTWPLENRVINGENVMLEDCSATRQITFKYTTSATDKDSAYYINYKASCPDVADTLAGYWYVAGPLNKFETTDSLVLVWENMDSTYFKINTLTPFDLQIETYFTDSIQEDFMIMN